MSNKNLNFYFSSPDNGNSKNDKNDKDVTDYLQLYCATYAQKFITENKLGGGDRSAIKLLLGKPREIIKQQNGGGFQKHFSIWQVFIDNLPNNHYRKIWSCNQCRDFLDTYGTLMIQYVEEKTNRSITKSALFDSDYNYNDGSKENKDATDLSVFKKTLGAMAKYVENPNFFSFNSDEDEYFSMSNLLGRSVTNVHYEHFHMKLPKELRFVEYEKYVSERRSEYSTLEALQNVIDGHLTIINKLSKIKSEEIGRAHV